VIKESWLNRLVAQRTTRGRQPSDFNVKGSRKSAGKIYDSGGKSQQFELLGYSFRLFFTFSFTAVLGGIGEKRRITPKAFTNSSPGLLQPRESKSNGGTRKL
jgi:hypothetical protein